MKGLHIEGVVLFLWWSSASERMQEFVASKIESVISVRIIIGFGCTESILKRDEA